MNTVMGWVILIFVITWLVKRRHRHHQLPRVTYRDPRGARIATPDQRRALWWQQCGNCAWCGRSMCNAGPIEADHIVPWVRGGATVLPNLRLVHKSCHQQITAREFGGWRGSRAA